MDTENLYIPVTLLIYRRWCEILSNILVIYTIKILNKALNVIRFLQLEMD